MGFFGFGTSAPAAPEENVIPEEEELLVALRTAYRDPNITTTKAMHLDVLARHPNWTVNLKRVRKLLCKVVSPPEGEQADDASSRRTWTEVTFHGRNSCAYYYNRYCCVYALLPNWSFFSCLRKSNVMICNVYLMTRCSSRGYI